MRTLNKYLAVAFTCLSLMAMEGVAAKTTTVAFTCGSQCLTECPVDIDQFCESMGCATTVSSCSEFGTCSGNKRLVYCGTPLEQ